MMVVWLITVSLTLQHFVTAHSGPAANLSQQLAELSLSSEEFEKVADTHLNWYLFSLKAIMVQMAKELLHNIEKGHLVHDAPVANTRQQSREEVYEPK
ncbi:hypothetical protein KIN20_032571 [Parelaphostrongylus tenuis]|uniref:Uncharacterized protein n=1 Tax=Parelaphostrongylus tenuis TaxID=148309 RepID=A0AAD5R7B7_PARTN|nr:hypothetical protein KIN20_032571 [Parelaphostrongylus tenuis]